MLGALALGIVLAQDWPQTRAESTNYAETSHYSDVIGFLEGLEKAGAPVRLTYIGVSTEGKKMPLLIAARPMVKSPEEAHKQGKLVAYIQANIHAGEVEGKEAILHLLRSWCKEKRGILDKVVFLVNPIYNIDGNEKFGPQGRNRPGQNGPDLVGVRANGGGFDLNRDYVKAETPEMVATLKSVWVPWRPDLMMDLHTTDGTRHGYPLTWAPPLNPNTFGPLYLFTRDQMMPAVRKELEGKGLRTFDYGNDETVQGKRGWYSVSAEARYSTNYAGMVNCIGVLSEALVYLPFKDRIRATEDFVTAVVSYAADHRKEILSMKKASETAYARGKGNRELGTRFEFGVRGDENVWLEKKPAKTGVPTDLEQVKLTIYDRFVATRRRTLPSAYIVRGAEKKVIDLLLRHGVQVDQLDEAWHGTTDAFVVREFHQDGQAFQGHKLIRLECDVRSGLDEAKAGDYVVRCDQPLTILANHLLEPENTDGAIAWGFFGENFKPGDVVSVVSVPALPKVKSHRVRA
ncbi:MAG: M14 family metallopeptidase [Armatimonadetes bacterium]|nr:M14 family metallopeptidase [Armatimonadota bacterium]